MSTTAPTRAKLKTMTLISARSRSPTTVEVSMLSSKARASSGVSTGVLPRLTTCVGPRTAWAGLVTTVTVHIYRFTSQSGWSQPLIFPLTDEAFCDTDELLREEESPSWITRKNRHHF